MKKVTLWLWLCFLCSVLEATPTGNPAFPKVIEEGFIFSPASCFSFRLGYEGNFILDRRLIQNRVSSNKVKSFSSYLNSGLLTINFLKRLDLFATYGIGRIETDWIIQEIPNSLTYIDLGSKYKKAWSVGTKIIFFEWGKTTFSAGGRYFDMSPTITFLSKSSDVVDVNNDKIKFKEWQIDIGLSYKADIFIPYLCAKYSKAKVDLSIKDVIISSEGNDYLEMTNRNNYGMALGCSFSNSKYFMLNAEVRLIDEEAFTVSGEFKF